LSVSAIILLTYEWGTWSETVMAPVQMLVRRRVVIYRFQAGSGSRP
jgi:hypothetical protein